MVWFYHRFRIEKERMKNYFQSHFGLILSNWRDGRYVCRERPFNPILVWFYHHLKLALPPGLRSLSIPFWSDFIVIKKKELTCQLTIFQSHFGLILSRCSRCTVCLSLSFNPILVWFYRFSSERESVEFDCLLSIPFWSDFIYRIRKANSRSNSAFNPILVWFYRALSCRLLE